MNNTMLQLLFPVFLVLVLWAVVFWPTVMRWLERAWAFVRGALRSVLHFELRDW